MDINNMNLDLFEWKNGTKIQNAVLEADGVTVQDAIWEGETPISASNLDLAQKKLAYALLMIIGDLNNLSTTEKSDLVQALNEVNDTTNKILWSDANGVFMKSTQSATLSENISKQRTGIVFHWQGYENNKLQNYDHAYFFVPKQHVVSNNGYGVVFDMATADKTSIGGKYVYISDGKVTGNDLNEQTGTKNGVTYNNKHWVLVEILGV